MSNHMAAHKWVRSQSVHLVNLQSQQPLYAAVPIHCFPLKHLPHSYITKRFPALPECRYKLSANLRGHCRLTPWPVPSWPTSARKCVQPWRKPLRIPGATSCTRSAKRRRRRRTWAPVCRPLLSSAAAIWTSQWAGALRVPQHTSIVLCSWWESMHSCKLWIYEYGARMPKCHYCKATGRCI